MEKQLNIKELREGLFLLDEAGESTGYLLIGEKKACLIDTMNGYNDLSKVVKEYTDKPVVVVNTHGHPDHVFGNVFFDKAYMNEKDFELAKSFVEDDETVEWFKEENLSMPPFENIKAGDSIDLGGRTLEIYEIPGHTPGGILLLCPEERILFTGDSINHHCWMQLDGCLSIEEYIEVIENLVFLEEKADFLLHGHAKGFDDISLISAMLGGLKEIFEGKREKDTEYHYFGGAAHAMYHPFNVQEGKSFGQDDHGICYQPDNIFATR